MRKNISLTAAVGIALGIDLRLPHKLDQTRQEWRKLAREVEMGINLMEGDGVGRDGVPWVDRSFELSTQHRD